MANLTVEERLFRLEKFLKITPPEWDSLKLSDEEQRKQLGGRVHIMRKLRGLTQSELAKRINTTQSIITNYETGRREPGVRHIIALSRILGVTTDWLLGETEGDDENWKKKSDEKKQLTRQQESFRVAENGSERQ